MSDSNTSEQDNNIPLHRRERGTLAVNILSIFMIIVIGYYIIKSNMNLVGKSTSILLIFVYIIANTYLNFRRFSMVAINSLRKHRLNKTFYNTIIGITIAQLLISLIIILNIIINNIELNNTNQGTLLRNIYNFSFNLIKNKIFITMILLIFIILSIILSTYATSKHEEDNV